MTLVLVPLGVSPAHAAPKQVVSSVPFDGVAGDTGGRFQSIQDIAVNEPGGAAGDGDFYVLESSRVQQFDAAGNFIRAWGYDVELPAADPPTSAVFEKCTIAANCQSGAFGVNAGQLGGALSIAIDQADGSVWVAANSPSFRHSKFDADGDFLFSMGWDVIPPGAPGDISEEQTVTVDATGGTFALTFGDQATAAIPYDATAAIVQEELENLSNLNPGDVSVSGAEGGPWTVEFTGVQKGVDVAEMTADPANLTGGAQSAAVATDVQGTTFTGYEICTTATGCQAGIEPPSNPEGPLAGGLFVSRRDIAVDPRNGDLLTIDGGVGRRVQRHNADGTFDKVMGLNVVPGGDRAELESCTSMAPGGCKAGTESQETSVNVMEKLSGGLERPQSLAVDSGGNYYIVDVHNLLTRVQKFTPEGTSASVFAPDHVSGVTEPVSQNPDKGPREVAVDPSNDHVYVLRFRSKSLSGVPPTLRAEVVELDAGGGLVEIHTTVPNPSVTDDTDFAPGPMAINGNRILRTHRDGALWLVLIGDTPQPPQALANPATAITKTSATLNGEVNPNGYFTDYHIEYRRKGLSVWKRVPPAEVEAGSGEAFVPVSQPVTGLAPGATYETRVVATKRYGGGVATSAPTTFQTLPEVPGVSTAAAYQVGEHDVKFVAFVDPNNLPTTYRFEYGTADCDANPCSSMPIPDGDAGAQSDWTKVSALAAGLDVGPTYHFRIVATNAVGTTEGVDTTFALGATPPASSQRAYEQVSPSDKNGVDVGGSFYHNLGLGATAAVSPDGGAASFTALGPFADSKVGCVIRCDYVSRRGATGWTTNSITPDPLPDNATAYQNHPMRFSEDLREVAQLSGYRLEATPDDPSGIFHLDLAKGLTTLIPGTTDDNEGIARFGWTSDDLGRIGYNTEEVLTDDGQPAANMKSYVYGNGSVELLSILPDGTFPTRAFTGSFFGDGGDTSRLNGSKINTVSDSGQYAFFTAPSGFPSGFGGPFGPPGLIYRRDLVNDTTVMVSPSKRTTPDPFDPFANWGRMFDFATPDGQVVLFRSFKKLTDDATSFIDGSLGSFGDLYRYDIPSDTLVDISVDADKDDPQGAKVQGVVAATDDAKYVYYMALGEVVSGATAGKPNIYMWRDDGTPDGETKFVATLDPADSDVWTSAPRGTGGYRRADVSDDGKLVFQSVLPLTQNEDDELSQVFLYEPEADGGDGQIHCVSCRPDGGTALGSAVVPPAALRRAGVGGTAGEPGGVPVVGGETTRVISRDGRTIAFESQDALVPEDINGKRDVYEWRDGEISQVSTGTDSADSDYMGMSENGRDVFFRTRQKLLPTDGDTLYDLYDARRGGGFPISKLPPCSGEECRPEPQDKPTVDVAGSGYFAGGGNVTEPPKARRCPKGKRQVKQRGKVRCIPQRKGKGRKTNRANANQGGAK